MQARQCPGSRGEIQHVAATQQGFRAIGVENRAESVLEET